MNKEEIENRILICEIRENGYREVGNIKTADRYSNERYKWKELLNQLNPRREEELRDYKKGFYNLKQTLNEIREYIEPFIGLDTCTLKGTMLRPILKEIDKVLEDEK